VTSARAPAAESTAGFAAARVTGSWPEYLLTSAYLGPSTDCWVLESTAAAETAAPAARQSTSPLSGWSEVFPNYYADV